MLKPVWRGGRGKRELYFLPTVGVSDFVLLKAEALIFQDLSSSICSHCVTLTCFFPLLFSEVECVRGSPVCRNVECLKPVKNDSSLKLPSRISLFEKREETF